MENAAENKERGAAITEQQVFETCDDYFNQHKKEPSQQIIRGLIGGSPVTIGPLLRKWKDKKEQEVEAMLLMPDHIRDTGLTMIATWWQSIQPTINELISTAQDQADKKIDIAEQKLADATATQVWLEQENDRLETLAEAARIDHQQQLELLQEQLKQHQLQLTQAHEHAQTEKEIKISELATIASERDSLKQQITQQSANIKTERAAHKRELTLALKDKAKAEAQRELLQENARNSVTDKGVG